MPDKTDLRLLVREKDEPYGQKPTVPIFRLNRGHVTEPGEYAVFVRACRVTIREGDNNYKVRLLMRVTEGPYKNQSVICYFDLFGSDAIWENSRYGRAARVALGRQLNVNDDLNPSKLFGGKYFLVRAGGRLRGEPGGYMRVHEILKLIPPRK